MPRFNKGFYASGSKIHSRPAYTETLLVGAFPGYIWGWFHVPDYPATFALHNYYTVYEYPAIGRY